MTNKSNKKYTKIKRNKFKIQDYKIVGQKMISKLITVLYSLVLSKVKDQGRASIIKKIQD